jgi:hypothetical protein
LQENVKNICILLTCLAFSPILFAQGKYENAALILTSGDTLKGFIQNKDWKVSPKSILFKTQLSDESVRYDVSQISSFHLHDSNELFESATVAVDKSISSEQNADVTAVIPETALIRVLLKGEVSLYHYGDTRDHFFVRRGQEKLTELVVEKKIVNKDGVSGIKITEKFKYTLSAVFDDCPLINAEIQKSRLTAKSLMNLFHAYYICKAQEPSYTETRVNEKIRTGVLAGYSSTSYRITGGQDYMRVEYENGSSPSVGAYVIFVGSRNFESWSFYNELLYQAYSINSKEPFTKTSGGTTWDYTNTASFSFLKLISGPRYQFPFPTKVRPFLNVGFSVSFPLKNDAHTMIHKYSTTSDTSEKLTYGTRRFEIGIWGGAGINYNRFSFEVRLERPKGWSGYPSMRVYTDNAYVLVAYRLSKE